MILTAFPWLLFPARGRDERANTGPVTMHTLGGYRILRTLGVGSRAEVLLAHPLDSARESASVAIKVYGESVSDESIVAEIEALTRAAGEHVVRVLDLESAGGSPALVLERCAAGSLARLLGDRPRLDAGEAVTILAPVATTLGRMHSAGVAHGSIGPGAVLFDAAGTPQLVGYGRAVLFEPLLPLASLESEQAALADVLAFASLAAGILEGAGATALAHRARTEAAPGVWLNSFADALFDLAEPLPVDVQRRRAPEAPLLPARVITAWSPAVLEEPASSGHESVWRGWARPAAWQEWLRGLRTSLRTVRRPVWAIAAASVAALVVAVLAVPPSGSSTVAAPSSAPSAPPLAAAAQEGDGPVAGDDPVAAVIVLLRVRATCIRELSVECFGDVDQRDSSALRSDREAVQEILAGGEAGGLPVVEPEEVVLTQRLGDSALVSLGPNSEPASVLLVKGEAGWRIRDYVTG
ncbi:hypothetical protein BH09ACT5_BH09ACT5_09050 [soil metagenome]